MSRLSIIYLNILPLLLCLALTVSCKKPNETGNAPLRFSQSQITFDTIFTSIGSITRNFTVHNTSNSDIIASVFVAGGKSSYYSINVNGMVGPYLKDVVIPKKDSIFVFVKVNINPGLQNNPFLVTDSIVFLTKYREQDVKLLAYGQDARFIIADPNTGFKIVAGEHETVRWTNERPYVIYGLALIDSTGTLIIEPGTRIYSHRGSGLVTYYSTLKVNGTLNEPVIFRGDRLESWFNDDFEQWGGIRVCEGTDAHINHAIITNARIGMYIQPTFDEKNIYLAPTFVKIENTIIRNTQDCGVLSRFFNLEMTNCVVANNGASSLQLEGGEYTMKHLTIANYFSQSERKAPACYVSNFVSGFEIAYEVKASFTNCIIFGSHDTEVMVGKVKEADLEASFQNCLVKAKENSNYFIDCIRNEDPKFTDIKKLDFKLLFSSPAIGRGKENIGVPYDILGNSRNNPPDIGAYQFVR